MADYFECELFMSIDNSELINYCTYLLMGTDENEEWGPTCSKLLPVPFDIDDNSGKWRQDNWGSMHDMEVFRYFIFENLIYVDYRIYRDVNDSWFYKLCNTVKAWKERNQVEFQIKLELLFTSELSGVMHVISWTPETEYECQTYEEDLYNIFPRDPSTEYQVLYKLPESVIGKPGNDLPPYDWEEKLTATNWEAI